MPSEACSSLPFGDGQSCGGADPASSPEHFTGKERDQLPCESGLDYFGARYYNSNMARWQSPDWNSGAVAVPYADLSDPQSLNLYGYVRNRPTFGVDADGHDNTSYILGVLNAWMSDNVVGLGRVDRDDADFNEGQAAGDRIALTQGGEEFTGGQAGVGAGTGLTLTGVGAPEGAVTVTGSAVLELHGTATSATAGANLLKSSIRPGNVPLSERDPKRYYTPNEKEELKSKADGKCEKCGTETQKVGNVKGQRPPDSQGQAAHKKSHAKGGRTIMENGEHNCRKCNLKDSDKK